MVFEMVAPFLLLAGVSAMCFHVFAYFATLTGVGSPHHADDAYDKNEEHSEIEEDSEESESLSTTYSDSAIDTDTDSDDEEVLFEASDSNTVPEVRINVRPVSPAQSTGSSDSWEHC